MTKEKANKIDLIKKNILNKNNMTKKKNNILKAQIFDPITGKLNSIKAIKKKLNQGYYSYEMYQDIQQQLNTLNYGYNHSTGNIVSINNKDLKEQISQENKEAEAVTKIANAYKKRIEKKKIKNQSIQVSYSPQGLLYKYIPYEIAKNNNLLGEYRIICIGNQTGHIYFDIETEIFSSYSTWSKENTHRWQYDSPTMMYQIDLELDLDGSVLNGEAKTFYFTKLKLITPQVLQQAFLDGLNHCFFTPILNWAKEGAENAKSQTAKNNYETIINKIQGKELKKNKYYQGKKQEPYLVKYKNGIPENEVQHVSDDLGLAFQIEQPFCNTPLIEVTSQKKARKKFKFINTRLNHIECNKNPHALDTIHADDYKNAIVVDRNVLVEMGEKMIDDKIDFIYRKDIYGICCIKTFDKIYTINNEYAETVQKFEEETGLRYCSIDAKRYPVLTNFISAGTHFNGTRDYVKVNKDMKDDDDTELIDMKKAFTQFKKCKFYNGFLGKITDFRQVDNFNEKGLYLIRNLDISNCHKKFKKHIEKLGWFREGNIYPDAELMMLQHYGATFEVTHGAYGLKMDFDFNEEMTNTKEVVNVDKKGNEIKVPYYAKYTGMITMTKEQKSFYLSHKEDLEAFVSMIKHNNNDTTVYYDDVLNEASVRFNKKYIFHKKHIASQILSYQRMIMMEQLLEMDDDKIIRVCVDGIYFKKHNFKKLECFAYKQKKTFENAECQEYLSGLVDTFSEIGEHKICNTRKYLPTAKPRKFYLKELFLGGGGSGKTFVNMTDDGLINVCYVGHSWKLASSKNKEFPDIICSVTSRFLNEPYAREMTRQFSNIIFDEASTITEHQKQIIMATCQAKLIFCGDLGFQVPPVITQEYIDYADKNNIDKSLLCEMNSTGFDNVIEMKKNFRSGSCQDMTDIIEVMRWNISQKNCISDISIQNMIKKIKHITIQELKDTYKKKDLILCATHIVKNKYTEMFKDIEKYSVLNKSRDYQKGVIIYEKKANVDVELRHGFTIHSIQGETAEKKIIIDMTNLTNLRVLYTAFSRAKKFSQLYIIDEN